MSKALLLNAAASGAAGSDPVYVDDVFSTYLYTGDGSTGSTTSITNGIDLSGEGGLVWIKKRDENRNHFLVDTARGVNQTLGTDRDITPQNTANSVTAFNSNGFSLGSEGGVNENGGGYVSWTFRKQPGFFDVVTYTGNGSARTISHNLGSVPGMILVKNLSGAYNWTIYHNSYGGYNYYNHINNNDPLYNNSAIWNATPTSTVFSVGTSGNTNENGDSYVAYLFAHDAQDFGTDSDEAIIKCGTYTGDTGPGGISINLGFEPQWVMIKDLRNGYDWYMFDTMRGWNDEDARDLKANESHTEANSSGNSAEIRPLANGFQVPAGNGTGLNASTGSSLPFIYMAIRRPHKPASEFASTKLFDVGGYTGAGGTLNSATQFPFDTDMFMLKRRNATGDMNVITRLIEYPSTGNNDTPKALVTSSSAAEADTYTFRSDDGKDIAIAQDGADNLNVSGGTYSYYGFRRAPEFFDVLYYTGTGSTRTVAHNLGVVPEMMWVKNRGAAYSWSIYHSGMGATKYARLNTNQAPTTHAEAWNDTAPTSSVFTVKDDGAVNAASHNFIAYLFASVAGKSKVGSYTGTGYDLNVDCGFSSGARFVLIKRTDSTGNWYVWDSVRGIVAGNDPYLWLDSDAAEVTNTDYIDPLSSGFTVTSSAPAELNTSSGTYIFYAIA